MVARARARNHCRNPRWLGRLFCRLVEIQFGKALRSMGARAMAHIVGLREAFFNVHVLESA